MSQRGLRRAVAVFTVLTFSVDNLGAANFLLAGPPPAALHLQALPRHPATLAHTPARPTAAPRALPRVPFFASPDTAKLLAPARRLLAWARAGIDAFYAPLPQEAIDLAPAPVLTKPVAPARILPALREAITTSAGELPPAPRMGDTPIVFDEEAFFASAPAPAYVPPPAVTPAKKAAPRRLKLTSSFMKITETGERVAGFQTMRLHWDKSYAQGLAPVVNGGARTPAATPAPEPAFWSQDETVRLIGRETGQDSVFDVYEVTDRAGNKRTVRVDPLVFDLSGHGVTTSPRVVLYDITGAGRADQLKRIHDIGAGTGVLVFDADKDGAAGEGGQELFGDATDLDGDSKPDGWSDGFAALRGLVEKAVRDGVLSTHVLSRGRLDAAALSALGKTYGLGMKVGGFAKPPMSLAKAGVVALWFSTTPATRHANFDGDGNDVSHQDGAVFTRADGSVGAYSDIWFAHK